MTTESSRIQAEIAHVLFVDLVGYSLLSMEDQARRVPELREVVRNTPEVLRARPDESDLILLDSGDGMALVFFRDPLSPIQCRDRNCPGAQGPSQIRLRMGIHSGPVSRMPDINGKATVTGSGINLANRVMSCGDAGHILISRSSADMVREFEAWANCLYDLGEFEVKHGVRVQIYNLLLGEVGNPGRPNALAPKLTGASKAQIDEQASPTAAAAPPRPSTSPADAKRIVLLYKRNAVDEERLQRLLGSALTDEGHSVFVDRHLRIGIEWATEIERQISDADAVIVLLSTASLQSEMLDYEVQVAHRVAEERHGLPRLLPVRVNYQGKLPDSLSSVLDSLQYSLWESPSDDDVLVRNVVDAVRARPEKPISTYRRESVGGAVPLDSDYYIVRPTDDEFKAAIARRDSIVLVKGGRQMGKTSLLARGLQLAREASARVVFTDFQALSSAHFVSTDTLYRMLADMIADQLDLETLPSDVWSASRSANMNFERYLRREVLGSVGADYLVWGLDEIDRLFTCDFGSEVFGLFRSWHNKRSLDPTGPWNRLTMAIAYATEAHLFITDLNQSPFNVGTRLNLSDFSRFQVEELNRRCGSPLAGVKEISRFCALIGGQPYLVRRGLDEMAAQSMPIEDFEAQASLDEGLFGDHLRRILISLLQDHAMTDAVRAVLAGHACPTPEYFYRLRAAGIIAGESSEKPSLRCQIYADYLSRHLK